MEFILTRKTFLPTRTFGLLTLDDETIGHVLEDRVREMNEPFILGETAIPYGKYRLIVSYSNRFKKQMIQVINMRGAHITFHGINIDKCGIRIHGGNTEKDTLGCPILGMSRKGDEMVYNCQTVNDRLINMVKYADQSEAVYLTIKKQTT